MKKILFALAPILMASAAHGAILTVVNSAPVTGLTGWTGYTLAAAPSNSGSFGLTFGYDVTITGPLHQQWSDPDAGAAYVPSITGTSTTNRDSHLLTPVGNIGFLGTQEDNSLAGSPLVSTDSVGYGTGTTLKGGSGFNPGQSQVNIAYIVLKNGTTASVSGAISNSSGVVDNFSGVVGVPEPATMSLIGLCGMGLLARRRKA